jgi:hypothetical protein
MVLGGLVAKSANSATYAEANPLRIYRALY